MTAVHAVSAIRNFDRLFIGPPRERCGQRRRLTVKLRGRGLTSASRRGRTLSSGARGAEPQAHHGPLQRLLEAMLGTDAMLETSFRSIALWPTRREVVVATWLAAL